MRRRDETEDRAGSGHDFVSKRCGINDIAALPQQTPCRAARRGLSCGIPHFCVAALGRSYAACSVRRVQHDLGSQLQALAAIDCADGALRPSPHRLVVRTSRCGRDNPGSTPGEDILLMRHFAACNLYIGLATGISELTLRCLWHARGRMCSDVGMNECGLASRLRQRDYFSCDSAFCSVAPWIDFVGGSLPSEVGTESFGGCAISRLVFARMACAATSALVGNLLWAAVGYGGVSR